MKRFVILIDTPNIFRSLQRFHRFGAHPDYRGIYQSAQRLGVVIHATAFVNDGVPAKFVRALERRGYDVVFPHAPDVDEALVAKAVEIHGQADCVVLCSGDGDYCSLVELLRAINVEVVVAAVADSCSRRLQHLSNDYMEVPLLGAG